TTKAELKLPHSLVVRSTSDAKAGAVGSWTSKASKCPPLPPYQGQKIGPRMAAPAASMASGIGHIQQPQKSKPPPENTSVLGSGQTAWKSPPYPNEFKLAVVLPITLNCGRAERLMTLSTA